MPLLLHDISYEHANWQPSPLAVHSTHELWSVMLREHALRAAMLHTMRDSLTPHLEASHHDHRTANPPPPPPPPPPHSPQPSPSPSPRPQRTTAARRSPRSDERPRAARAAQEVRMALHRTCRSPSVPPQSRSRCAPRGVRAEAQIDAEIVRRSHGDRTERSHQGEGCPRSGTLTATQVQLYRVGSYPTQTRSWTRSHRWRVAGETQRISHSTHMPA